MNSETAKEDLFVRSALASVEQAQKLQRLKQITVTAVAVILAAWLAFKPGPDVSFVEGLIVIALGIAISTAKILSLINKNTLAVLQAIAELRLR